MATIEKRPIDNGKPIVEASKPPETSRIQTATVADNIPKALLPVINTVWDMFSNARSTLPAEVGNAMWDKYAPVVEWNPMQAQPLALISRPKGDEKAGVFSGSKIGNRPALSIGPSWLKITKPDDSFSAVMLTYGDWVNLFGQTNRFERFTVDRNGFVRNRSLKKHAAFYESDLGVDPILGKSGVRSAIMSVRLLSGVHDRESGAPYWAGELLKDYHKIGSMAERFHNLTRFVPAIDSKRQTKATADKRGWYCECKTSKSDDANNLTRFVTKGKWCKDYCYGCNTFVIPRTIKGTDTCTVYIASDGKGQELLERVAKGQSEETQAMANLMDYDTKAIEAKQNRTTVKIAQAKLADALAKNPEGTMRFLDELEGRLGEESEEE